MDEAVSAGKAVVALWVLMSPVFLGAFLYRRKRGGSTADGLRFVGVAMATILGFVGLVSGASMVLGDSDDPTPLDCAEVGGAVMPLGDVDGDGRLDSMCVVGGPASTPR